MREINRRVYSIKSKKLARTTTFSVALFVAATLIISSSVMAIDLQGESTNVNFKINGTTTWISSAKENLPGKEGIPQSAPMGPLQPTDWIYFDDGTNDNSLGLTAGGTFEYGIRITPTELSGYDGYELTTVKHHHGWAGSTAPSVSGYVRIYDEGTPTSPGTLLHEQAYTTGSVPGWEEYTLTSSVTIDETKDLWVCLEVTHVAGEYPAGMDPGPAVDGKGDWIYLDPGPWQEIQDLGFDCNWNLWAGLEEGGPGAEHDVGVQSINSPSSGPAGVITPEVTVKNYGNNSETAVPVDMTVTAYGTPTTYFSDGFESLTAGYYDFTPGWTVETTNPTGTWFQYSSSSTYSASAYPRVQESGSDGGAQDESLISPIIDCSALSSVNLKLGTKYFYAYAPDFAIFTIYGSNDSGATWTQIIQYTATSTAAVDMDISAIAAGESNVQIRFRFQSDPDATLSSYAYIDNFMLYDPTYTWGTYGDNPPPGWTITNYAGDAWDYGEWHRYSSTSYDMYGTCARMYYVSGVPEEVNDELISPSIDCSGLSTAYLSWTGYFYYSSSYQNQGYIEISVDNGVTWEQVDVNTYTAYTYEHLNYLDITSLAAGESNVKICFRFTRPAAATAGGYWYIDNVGVGTAPGNFIFKETFDGAVYHTGFKQWVPDDWGNWTWNKISMLHYNNQWFNVMSGSSPTCTPYEGSAMAQYLSYSAYYGEQARLYSIPINVAAANDLKMSFAMFHDTGDPANNDIIEVQASHDGITWETMGTFNRIDGTAGWSTCIVDLTGYEDDTALQIAFLAISSYGYNMYIDDVQIFDPGLITEYSETVYVDIALGETKDVTFPAWTPDAWQAQGGVDIVYEVFASTNLPTDENADNDQKQATIILNYPHLHDIQVLSVDTPAEDGPAQTLPVKCTIKNVGQFPECCYQTTVEIGEVLGAFIDEDFSGGVPPSGWGTTHPSNWGSSATSNAGGTAPEARFSWTPSATAEFRLYTGPMDTTAYTNMNLKFKEYVNDYNGAYTLKVETSTDGVTWNTAYSRAGGPYGPTTTVVPLDSSHGMGSSTLQVAFTFSGYSFNINYWYIDDVELKAPIIIGEYEEFVCTIELDPGEEAQLEFDDWTPDALALGVSGPRNYMAIGTQMLPGDTNPANDMAIAEFTLDYYHDALVKEITEPSTPTRAPWDLLFSYNLEIASGALGNAGAEFDGTYFYSARWATNLIHQYDLSGTLVKEFSIPGVTGLRDLAYNDNTGYFYGGAAAGTIWEMDFASETLVSTITGSFQSRAIAYNPDDDVIYCSNWGDPVWVVDPSSGAILNQFNLVTAISTYGMAYDNTGANKHLYVFDQGAGAGTPQYIYQWDLDAGVMTGFSYDVTVDFPTTAGIAGGLFVHDGYSGKVVCGGLLQGTPDMMFVYELREGGGPVPHPPISIWVAPGTHPIETIVGNDGTFVETGLTCYAELDEWITDPGNATFVWGDDIGNIDLDPLGDEETLSFGSVDFSMQGPYGLYIEIPLANDDTPNNNLKVVGIGVDDTEPASTHTLDPATPNGLNGWYTTDVTVTLDAEDGTEAWQSDVKEINYRVNGGTIQTITGAHGSFALTQDGEDVLVEYWSVDKVGNEETPHNQFTVDIDQTKPEIDASWEAYQDGDWYVRFTISAADATSGMQRVEMYINDGFHDEVIGVGPDYEFIIQWSSALNTVTFRFVAYDTAGLEEFDEINGGDINAVPYVKPQSIPNSQSQPVSSTVQTILKQITPLQK